MWRSRSIYAFLNAATATTTLFAAGRSSLWHLSFRGARARGSTCRPAPSKTALPTLPPTGSSCGPATATQRGSCSSTSIARLTAAPGAPCARGTTFRVVPLFATPSGLAGQGAVNGGADIGSLCPMSSGRGHLPSREVAISASGLPALRRGRGRGREARLGEGRGGRGKGGEGKGVCVKSHAYRK